MDIEIKTWLYDILSAIKEIESLTYLRIQNRVAWKIVNLQFNRQ